jgi:hypothetical protein
MVIRKWVGECSADEVILNTSSVVSGQYLGLIIKPGVMAI